MDICSSSNPSNYLAIYMDKVVNKIEPLVTVTLFTKLVSAPSFGTEHWKLIQPSLSFAFLSAFIFSLLLLSLIIFFTLFLVWAGLRVPAAYLMCC